MEHVYTVDQVIGGLILAQIIPLIVGYVTERTAGTLQTWLLIGLTALTTVINEIVNIGEWQPGPAAIRFFTLFAAAVISYKGWQKETIAPVVQASGLKLGAPPPTGAPR